MTTTDDDEKRQNASRHSVVDGNKTNGPFQRVRARVHKKLDGPENDRTEAGSDARGNNPRSRDLGDTLTSPFPVHADVRRDGDAYQGADNGLSGTDREAESSAKGQPGSRA